MKDEVKSIRVGDEEVEVPLTTSEFLRELTRIGRVFISACERFYWGDGFSKAASLAYTSLFSLVPITFVGFGFLASVAVSNQELVKAREFIFRQFIPNQETVSLILEKLLEIDRVINSSSFNVAAVAIFAITALLLINSVEHALNNIWQVYEPRPIAQRISIFCAFLVIGPVVMITAYYTTKVRVEPFLMGFQGFAPFGAIYNHMMSFLLDLIAFFILYFLVPKAPVKIMAAFFGAFMTAVMFDIAKYYFAIYIVSFSSYDKLYGALAAIPIFLFWLYISWTIILFGSEICYQYQYLPKNGRIWKKQVTSVGQAALLLACQSLVLIGRAFVEGTKPPSELEISERLGCSSLVLKPIISSLKQAGIVIQGEARDMPLLLQKGPQKVTVKDILHAIYPGAETMQLPIESSRFFAAFASKDEEHANNLTLSQLLSRE